MMRTRRSHDNRPHSKIPKWSCSIFMSYYTINKLEMSFISVRKKAAGMRKRTKQALQRAVSEWKTEKYAQTLRRIKWWCSWRCSILAFNVGYQYARCEKVISRISMVVLRTIPFPPKACSDIKRTWATHLRFFVLWKLQHVFAQASLALKLVNVILYILWWEGKLARSAAWFFKYFSESTFVSEW